MERSIRQIFRNISMAVGLIFSVVKKIDYKTLSRYIIGINEMKNLNGILLETSKCLKDLLDYKLFAFVVSEGEKLDVWVDPSIASTSLEKIIQKDFNTSKNLDIHRINEKYDRVNNVLIFNAAEIESYILADNNYFAKLYILPNRKIFAYHVEIIDIIIKTLGVAFTNLMNIKHLENVAAIDGLTGCYNRREFDRLIEHNLSNTKRYNKNLSIVMIDIDFFKRINDTYGHLIGDVVLKKVSQAIREEIRKGDYLARYGGEEFVLALPETNIVRAMELAERIRNVIEMLEIKTDESKTVRVTASFGIAALKNDSNKETLLQEADEMLYKAKTNGRNRIMPGLKLYSNNNISQLNAVNM